MCIFNSIWLDLHPNFKKMKQTIKFFTAFVFASIIALTSCSKDETTTVTETKVTLSDSLGKNTINSKEAFALVSVKVELPSGTTLKTAKFERKIGTASAVTIFDNNRMDTVTDFEASSVFPDDFEGVTLVGGEKVVYTLTVTDSKSKTAIGSTEYTVVRENGIIASSVIELGAQANTAVEYKFLGLADNFATYTAGTSTANSSKIDFVYYYGATGKNALAAPSNVDGAQVIWDKVIADWATKNETKFKTTALTATEFDNIMNTTKVDDTFYNLDFSAATDKVTELSAGDVVAFKTAAGVVGLAKFTAVASANDGSMKIQIICQK